MANDMNTHTKSLQIIVKLVPSPIAGAGWRACSSFDKTCTWSSFPHDSSRTLKSNLFWFWHSSVGSSTIVVPPSPAFFQSSDCMETFSLKSGQTSGRSVNTTLVDITLCAPTKRSGEFAWVVILPVGQPADMEASCSLFSASATARPAVPIPDPSSMTISEHGARSVLVGPPTELRPALAGRVTLGCHGGSYSTRGCDSELLPEWGLYESVEKYRVNK